MTAITETAAYEAMLEHHKRLGEELAVRADAVSGAVAAGRPYGAAVAGLIAYLAEEVLPHAAAEERTVYPAAAAHADMTGLVGEMIAEHVTLSALGARLAALTDSAAAAEQARQIARLFTTHAAKENDIVLPALVADQSVDLTALLERMHGGAGERAHDPAPAQPAAGQAEDPLATVVALLLQAAAALARAGDADRACKIAASAWAALRDGRPDLAAKVTAALPKTPGRPAAASPTRCLTSATSPRRGAMRRSSARTGTWRRTRVLCLSTTTIPSRCATSSRPSTRASTPGNTWRPGRRSGG